MWGYGVFAQAKKPCHPRDLVIWVFIPCHTIVAGYYGFTLDVHFSVLDDNLSKHQSIFTKNLVCALIL